MSTRKLIQSRGGVKYLATKFLNIKCKQNREKKVIYLTMHSYIAIYYKDRLKIYMYTSHTDNSKVNRSGKYNKEYSLNFNI